MEECCEVIKVGGGEPNDLLLVQLTKLQFINEKIRLSGIWEIAFSSESAMARAPLNMYLQAHKAELDTYLNGVSTELRDDGKQQFLLERL
jgi:hypothetical protein